MGDVSFGVELGGVALQVCLRAPLVNDVDVDWIRPFLSDVPRSGRVVRETGGKAPVIYSSSMVHVHDWDEDELTWACRGDRESCIGAALKSALYVATATILARNGGMLVHASGWVRDGVAAVFFGPSGAGKSTLIASAADHEYLSDEAVALVRASSGWEAHGTPFTGSDTRPGSPRKSVLEGLYAVHQAEGGARVRCLSSADAVHRLVRCVMLPSARGVTVSNVLGSVKDVVESGLVRAIDVGRGVDPWPAIKAYGR